MARLPAEACVCVCVCTQVHARMQVHACVWVVSPKVLTEESGKGAETVK